MLHENLHVPYKNAETNPRIKPSKILGATEFCSSGQVSNRDDVIDFHINYHIKYQRQTRNQNMMYHWKLTLTLSLIKRKIIQKIMFNKRKYLKRIIYRMVKEIQMGKVCHPMILQQQKHATIVNQQENGKIINGYLLQVIASLNT